MVQYTKGSLFFAPNVSQAFDMPVIIIDFIDNFVYAVLCLMLTQIQYIVCYSARTCIHKTS